MLRLHRPALLASETLDVLLRIGRCQTELQNPEAAIAAYREAKAIDPRHRAAGEALASLQAERGDWSAWVAEREALAALAGPEASSLWEAIGDACAQHLGDAARAEAAYRKALEIEPNRRSTIEKLLAIHLVAGRFEPAVEMLRARARVETDPAVRAETYHQAARLLLAELDRPAEAAQLLECCLEDAPGRTEALQQLVELREKAGDWQGLAQSYRALLDRLPPDAPRELRLALWGKLGDLALRRLRDRPLAMTAYEAAAALAPDDLPRLELLAHVYELVGPDARDRAIAAHQRLIAHDPHRTDSYLALAKLFGELQDLDKQWCVAATLWYLKKTNPALEELFRRLRPPQVRPARQPFSEETWRRVRHPDEDRRFDQVFAIAAPFLAAPAAQSPASLGLKRRAQIDVAHDESLPVRSLVALCRMLALPIPDLFRIEGETGQTTLFDVQYKSGPRPVLLLGPQTLRRNSFDLIFDLTTHLSLLRPERFSKVALQTPAGLQLGWQVLRALAGPGGASPEASEAVQLKAYLQRAMPPAIQGQLADAVRKLGDGRVAEAELGKWSAATDLTGLRAALVLTGELGAAFRVISSEPVPKSPVPVNRRMADLVAFSVSDDYFACRRQLGLAVDTAGAFPTGE
jgi:tetratricopeptide (TPR) repeat protein